MFDAFAQDNIAFGSNYVQHTLSVDFVPRTNVVLNATFYRYRPNRLYTRAAETQMTG